MGFDVTNVVFDGSGKCPYHKSLAKFFEHKRQIARHLMTKGYNTKIANKQAETQAESVIKVHHCRDCSRLGYGCCKTGTNISFKEVKS